MAGLVLLYAPKMESVPGVVFVPESGELVLGREPGESGFAIPGASASRKHAAIARSPSGLSIHDLGSRNGLIVNGALVRRYELREGDELRIGDAIFRVALRDFAAYAPFHPARGNANEELVGGTRMAPVRDRVHSIAASHAPVLVLGEPGTGKKFVGAVIHRASARRGKFSVIECSMLAGPDIDRAIAEAAASAGGGTVFIGDVDDAPRSAQDKCLSMLESRAVRLLFGSRRDVSSLVREGRFSVPLYARLEASLIQLPPLRSRKEDIYPLVVTFLRKHDRTDVKPDVELMAPLLHYAWPGNVRELEAAVRRVVNLADGKAIDESMLPSSVLDAMMNYGMAPSATAPSSRGDWPRPSNSAKPNAEELRSLLVKHAGDVSAIAHELGKQRALVYRWIRQNGLDPDTYRREPED